MKKSKRLSPIHPGEILREDFLRPFGLSMNKLAIELRVPVTRVAEIVHERRGITTDTALRLGRYFGTTPQFWMNLQRDYELELAEEEIVSQIEQEIVPLSTRSA